MIDPKVVAADAWEGVMEFNKVVPPPKSKVSIPPMLEPISDGGICLVQVDVGCFVDGFTTFGCVLKNFNGEFM